MSHLNRSGFSIHGNCVNFSSGFCTLNNVRVDPNGTACINFMSKNGTPQPQIRHSFPPHTVHLWSSPHTGFNNLPSYTLPPQTWYGYRTGRNFGPVSSIPTTSWQGGAGLLYMSSGRRGGGRGGGGGGGRGRMGGFGAGPGGSCVCPRCGYSTSHVIGTPCYQQTCPKCGSRMTRGS